MKRTSLILLAVFALVMLPMAFAQSTASPDPSQSPSAQSPSGTQSPSSTQTPSTQDPTSQSPSSTQSPSTQNPSTSQPPDTSSSSSSSSSTTSDTQAHSFVGSIGKDSSGKFVLHAGTNDYQLDDQTQAQKYDGKTVKVTGRMDQSSNTIHVQNIEAASSM